MTSRPNSIFVGKSDMRGKQIQENGLAVLVYPLQLTSRECFCISSVALQQSESRC